MAGKTPAVGSAVEMRRTAPSSANRCDAMRNGDDRWAQGDQPNPLRVADLCETVRKNATGRGGIRTHTPLAEQGILSPQCLPFHHAAEVHLRALHVPRANPIDLIKLDNPDTLSVRDRPTTYDSGACCDESRPRTRPRCRLFRRPGQGGLAMVFTHDNFELRATSWPIAGGDSPLRRARNAGLFL